MSINLQLPKLTELKPRLTVIGVGGAGGNAVNNMIASGLAGVDFIVANTDSQALLASSAERRVQLGVNLTEGLGAGSKPEIGASAAEEAIEDIRAQIAGSHMVFIAAGMGGGTGTGAASVIARAARELGILTVGVVTKPFQFEGTRRLRIAEAGIAELRNYVDTLIVIPNQNLFRIANERTTFSEAFVLADQVLYSGIACIVDLIVKEGLINLDFADVRTVMSGMGSAMMGTGEATGERRAVLAAEEAISNPLLDDVSLKGAKGLLLSIIGGRDLTLYEVDEAASRVRQEVDPEANIIVGATFDDSMGDRLRVAIVASGMARADAMQQTPPAPAPASRLSELQRSSIPTPAPPAPVALPAAAHAGAHGSASPPPLPGAGGVPGTVTARLPEELASGVLQQPQPVGRPVADIRHHGVPDDRMPPAWQPAPAPPHVTPREAPAATGRAVWVAPGNVMIEDGPPPVAAVASVAPVAPVAHVAPASPRPTGAPLQQQPMQQPYPGHAPAGHAPGETTFAPAPPYEIRRVPRMPEVEDFPAVGQQAYRARAGQTEPPPPSPAPPPRVYDAAVEPAAKRGGLFQRLVGGRGRKDDDEALSQNRQSDARLPVFFNRDKG